MEPAICGSCRSGYCRCGVYLPQWDDMVEALKKVPKQTGDPCIAGGFRAGYMRAAVYIPLFDELLENLKKSV